MKNLGWNFFFSLLLADVVAVVMVKLAVPLKIVLTVSVLVFAILAVVMLLSSNGSRRAKRREEEATARIAELENQVKEGPADRKDFEEVKNDPAK